MDALNDCKTRITALETNNRNIAQTVGSNTEKINTLAADIQAYKNYLNGVVFTNEHSVEHSHKSVEQKIEGVMNSSAELMAASASRIVNAESRIQAIEQAMNTLNEFVAKANSMPSDPLHFRMHTPAEKKDEWVEADPWQGQRLPNRVSQPMAPTQQLPAPALPGQPLNESPFAEGPAPPAADAREPSAERFPPGVPASFRTPAMIQPEVRSPLLNRCPAGASYQGPVPGAGINVGPDCIAPAFEKTKALTFEVDRKKNDSLKKFSGNVGEYQMWRDRILDHLCRSNRRWRHVLETLQVLDTPVRKEWLMTQSDCGYSGWEISQILEGFLV